MTAIQVSVRQSRLCCTADNVTIKGIKEGEHRVEPDRNPAGRHLMRHSLGGRGGAVSFYCTFILRRSGTHSALREWAGAGRKKGGRAKAEHNAK